MKKLEHELDFHQERVSLLRISPGLMANWDGVGKDIIQVVDTDVDMAGIDNRLRKIFKLISVTPIHLE